MKRRTGWVSNSSSSSFIVAYKGDEKSALDRLEKMFDVPEGHILKPIVDKLGKTVVEHLDDDYVDRIATMDELLEYSYAKDEEELEDQEPLLHKLTSQGFKIIISSVSNEADSIADMLLYESGLRYESDDLVVIFD